MIGRHASLLACVALSGLLIPDPVPALAQGNVAIIPIDRTMWAVKRANVRSGMGTTFTKVGLLEVGEQVRVTGVGDDGEWLRIERPDGRYAFVYAPLLAAMPPQGALAPTTPAGRQTITYPYARYEGEVRDGLPHGRGTMTWNNGTRYYEGEWQAGKKHGQGIRTWPDGTRYEGGWRNDEHHGQGTKTYPNGARYEGKWRDGEYHGRGTYTWANGNRYEGEIRDGKEHGQGLWIGAGGAYYVGEWQAGNRHGQGSRFWANGSRYEGSWRDGKRHGQGVLIFVNGKRYGGEWRNGCFGKRGGRWAALGASAADCGFK